MLSNSFTLIKDSKKLQNNSAYRHFGNQYIVINKKRGC